MVARLFAAAALALLVIAASPAFSDIQASVDLTDYFMLLRSASGSFGAANLINGALDFQAVGNDNVKGELELDSTITDTAALGIKRAWVKVRFPAFRITAGKTRVSFGDGFFFNAGDVIFGSTSLEADLFADVLRDDTELLASVYVPLERFSFIEGIVLPNPTSAAPGIPLPVDVSHLAAGGRIVSGLFGTKLEAGYLFDGKSASHKPYASIQGNLLIDWNLSASCSIPTPDFDAWKDTIAVSMGLFSLVDLGDAGSMSLRIESLLEPYEEWNEADSPPAPPAYGIYFYPEVSYAPGDTLSFLLRSIISPVDYSAVVFGGAYWNVYQGLTIGFLASAMLGESDDTFGWDKDGGLSFIISLRYIFGTEAGSGDE